MVKNMDRKQQFIDFISERSDAELKEMTDNMKILMSYYRCAMFEIETKFRVLNEQFSIEHERNPIESIKTRLKSLESIREASI